MAEVDAEHTLICAHQRQRIELKPRRAREHRQHRQHVALLAVRQRGNAEHPEPSRGREKAISFLERFTADGIEDKFNAAAIGDFARPRLEIIGPVIDEVIDSQRA